MSAAEMVNKAPALPAGRWNYAHVLRDDGVGYLPASLCSAQAGGDYVEQNTYLIFLKMADERAALTPTLSRGEREKGQVPDKFNWAKQVKLDGDDLELQYRHTLENLGKQGGTCLPVQRRQVIGTIFRKVKNKFHQLDFGNG